MQICDVEQTTVGIRTTHDNKEVVRSSDVVILAVKPYMVPKILFDESPLIHTNHLVISIAAGVTISQIEQVTTSTPLDV